MSKTSEKARIRAEGAYHSRVEHRSPLTKPDCVLRSGFSARQIDNFEADGTLVFQIIGNRKRIAFAAFESFMPGGADSWMTATETAAELGVTKRKLELMRKHGEGPDYRFFSPKLLRYLRSSVAAYKLITTQTV